MNRIALTYEELYTLVSILTRRREGKAPRQASLVKEIIYTLFLQQYELDKE